MRRRSLAFRLFISAAAWSLLVLPLTAVILVSVYQGAVERSFDARLKVYLTALVANAAASNDLSTSPPTLPDPNFALPFSGWYWQIAQSRENGRILHTSESLLDQQIRPPDKPTQSPEAGLRSRYVAGPESQSLRVAEQDINLPRGKPEYRDLTISVAGDAAEIQEVVAEFQTLVIIALSILGIGLLAATFFQVRYGLRPLEAIGHGLSAIRAGDAQLLEGDLPSEIEPLQRELNALIESNRAIVERARTHVGNLAHALKTPLSVITNEAGTGKGALAKKVREQAQVMRDQIDHHLNRARIASRAGIVGARTPVKPVLEALVRTLDRIYSDHGLDIILSCGDELAFQGEKQDLEEMVGNLLDNACKWAEASIAIDVRDSEENFVIRVDDDGPGLPAKEREFAIKRGRRLDESKPGSGLGLSIVTDLAHLYNGQFSLEKSDKGGLRAVLTLPRC